ncbi:unnamed protein product, partial [Ectocarpus fasciculatus]
LRPGWSRGPSTQSRGEHVRGGRQGPHPEAAGLAQGDQQPPRCEGNRVQVGGGRDRGGGAQRRGGVEELHLGKGGLEPEGQERHD